MKYKKIKDNQWIVEVQENGKTKELFIEFPPDALNQVGWDEGDTLIWEEIDGGYKITKKPVEHGGPKGEEPTRYGTWESKGREIDF